ncbi:hypothetical protein RR48_09005 [Papilio machaon]|uniref:Uncharacterized protein n=1 Tax=Papilio machaon TaxID=76193 RepID=A0A194QZE2_PAPMA|nr:hypothetical protein RR48_09005 [Papilio machaon]
MSTEREYGSGSSNTHPLKPRRLPGLAALTELAECMHRTGRGGYAGEGGVIASLPRQRSMGVVVTMKMSQASCELRAASNGAEECGTSEARSRRGPTAGS